MPSSLRCWLHRAPCARSGLIHLVSSSHLRREIALVVANVHASVTRVVALSIRYAHVCDRTTAAVQSRASYPLVVSTQLRFRQSCAREEYTLVRELQRLRECNADGVVPCELLSEQAFVVVFRDTSSC